MSNFFFFFNLVIQPFQLSVSQGMDLTVDTGVEGLSLPDLIFKNLDP